MMRKLFQNKKLTVILSIVLVVLLAAGAGVLVWQLAKDDSPDNATYTVRFVTNGGNDIEAIEVAKGTVLSQTELPTPSKKGEMFLSWNTDEALTTPYWNTPIESDMTLYASYVEPVDNATVAELVESVIPFADTDFSVTVLSSVELTDENIANYVMLTVNYGQHADGDPIVLSVTPEESGIYRISGNYAAGGEYILSLMSDEVTFNPEDETLLSYGLTDALRTLRFRIIGETYMEGELSDKVADLSDASITVNDSDSITVSGTDRNLVGATAEENGIIRLGDGDDISDYYKVVAVESTSEDGGTTYNVRPAEVDEVYDNVSGYEWVDVDGESLVMNEDVLEQVKESLANNEQLNNYVKYLTLAAAETPTYQSMSTEEFGEVVVMPLNTVVAPSGIEYGLDFDAYNDKFVEVIGEKNSKKFAKLTLGIPYEVKLTKVGSAGTLTAEVKLEIVFWMYFGMGGKFELGFGEYDIDYGASVMTQTEITFDISVRTSDAKRRVNISDEIEAIYNSAKDPTPENLLEQYNELMSGNSKPIEIFNQDIFEVPVLSLLGGGVKISVPVRFVVSVEVEAIFSSYVTVLTANAFGIVGNDEEGLESYSENLPARFKYRFELRGHVEVRAGVEMGVQLSLGWGLSTVSLNAQVGFYGELHGYFFYEVERMGLFGNGLKTKNQGGAYYFEFGMYVELNLRAQVCRIKYKANLFEKKWPFFSDGQKEILYGFVNPTSDVITLEGNERSVHIDDTNILDVYVFDITEERSKDNPRKVTDFAYNNNVKVSFSNGDFGNDMGYIFCAHINKVSAMEAVMTIHYTGAQLSFRDTLTKKVLVRYSREANANFDNIGKTFTVDFTIDGETIFTREYTYGARISMQPALYYYTGDDGKVIAELRESEKEAVYNAGYKQASWNVLTTSADGKKAPMYVTENMTIEARSDTQRRPWKVTIKDGYNTEVFEVEHGEIFELPLPNTMRIDMMQYIYSFSGWKNSDKKLYYPEQTFTVTSDLTLTPQYQRSTKSFSVTYDANGGDLGNGSTTFTAQVEYGKTPNYPFTPERAETDTARYEFIGWSPEVSMVTSDVTYYAQWKEIKKYTVTFDAGEGQFDADGTRKVTVTVDEGHKLSAADLPKNPYKKTTGGYYAFDAWSGAAVGTVINGNVTFTASYADTLTVATGITVSDGTNTEDIQAYLDGTNKISGYTYTLSTEYYGNRLHITAPGLTVSGEATDIHITVTNTEVTLHELTLTQNERIVVILAEGRATINISGNVRLTANTDTEVIRGDASGEWDSVNGGYTNYADANIMLRGVGSGSKLTVVGQAYGIAVYGALTVDSLDIDITMPTAAYTDPETGYAYDAVALQVHNHPKGILTVIGSDITVNGGVVNAAWLDMTSSNLKFTAKRFVPGYSSGLHIMNYSVLTEKEALITLANSHISFTHDIAIALAVSLEDGTEYYVNTSLDEHAILSAYASLEAFLADVSDKGYDGMISLDGNSSIT